MQHFSSNNFRVIISEYKNVAGRPPALLTVESQEAGPVDFSHCTMSVCVQKSNSYLWCDGTQKLVSIEPLFNETCELTPKPGGVECCEVATRIPGRKGRFSVIAPVRILLCVNGFCSGSRSIFALRNDSGENSALKASLISHSVISTLLIMKER
ncbi:Hypothetical predicted protein [Podarcis lilfordi]|uniref:Uncharacterized protein n=1 Tax=Podarcis lilfordi TaxID=74358 RepID=A0AA35KT63_9SAUR|nr:Hypothetical predicted protein [Podarcis lilfordi]